MANNFLKMLMNLFAHNESDTTSPPPTQMDDELSDLFTDKDESYIDSMFTNKVAVSNWK